MWCVTETVRRRRVTIQSTVHSMSTVSRSTYFVIVEMFKIRSSSSLSNFDLLHSAVPLHCVKFYCSVACEILSNGISKHLHILSCLKILVSVFLRADVVRSARNERWLGVNGISLPLVLWTRFGWFESNSPPRNFYSPYLSSYCFPFFSLVTNLLLICATFQISSWLRVAKTRFSTHTNTSIAFHFYFSLIPCLATVFVCVIDIFPALLTISCLSFEIGWLKINEE